MDVASDYPWFKRGIPGQEGKSPVHAEAISTFDRRRADDPANYIPDEQLSHAVNVALALGMPLLLTGEPGTGKTQLAYAVANDLGCPLHKFETKSTSAAKDLFYSYDALTAFKMKEATDPRQFIRYQALGRAIVEAFPVSDTRLSKLLPGYEAYANPDFSRMSQDLSYVHPGKPRRSVVLIDEIDKAPRDFPNDLLNEIDRLHFRVPELKNAGTPGADELSEGVPSQYRPIVILTSNSEKGLPDPFLRRCVYFDIPFPDGDQMGRIVAARIAGLESGSPLLADAIDLFYSLRQAKGLTRLRKEPSTAELLNWLQILLHRGARPSQSLKGQADLVKETLSTLVKQATDRAEALDFVEKRWKSGATR